MVAKSRPGQSPPWTSPGHLKYCWKNLKCSSIGRSSNLKHNLYPHLTAFDSSLLWLMPWSISAGCTPSRSSNLGKSCCYTMTSRGSRRAKPRWNRLFWKREGRRGLLFARPLPSSMGSTTMRRYKNYIIFSVDLIFTITVKHITISKINLPCDEQPTSPSTSLHLF